MTNWETGFDPETNSEEIYSEEQVEESGEYGYVNGVFEMLGEQ